MVVVMVVSDMVSGRGRRKREEAFGVGVCDSKSPTNPCAATTATQWQRDMLLRLRSGHPTHGRRQSKLQYSLPSSHSVASWSISRNS